MSVQNLKTNEIKTFVNDLSSSVNLDIRVINHAPIPNNIEADTKQLSDSSGGKLIIYAYAFGANGVVETETLINAISTVNSEIELSLIETEPEVSECAPLNLTGWIVAVSVLAVLLLLATIFPLIYICCWKKKLEEERRISESASTKEIEENFDTEAGRSTPMPNTESQSQNSDDVRVGGQNGEVREGKKWNFPF